MILTASILALALLSSPGSPPQPQGDADATPPSLKTTLVDPMQGGRPLTFCADFPSGNFCGEAAGLAWCRERGFAGFDRVRLDPAVPGGTVRPATRVVAITCLRTPIV